jgi:hypothetical protein
VDGALALLGVLLALAEVRLTVVIGVEKGLEVVAALDDV